VSISASQIFFKGRWVTTVDTKDNPNLLPSILKEQELTYLGNNQANPFSPRYLDIKKEERREE
jgi:hypothetical protein